MASEMLLGTQHHTQMVRPPLSGADMGSVGWGADGTYLSGGGFVRQSQDSHRQYIFEWSGARSVEEASYMQALRDGVYSKSRRDLIYFIDPNIYDKNILPKRWAQPGILAPDSGSQPTPLGHVSKVDGPSGLGLPMTGAQVSSHFTSLAQFNATTEPQQGSVWVPVPPGKTLYVSAWTGNPVNSESGVYVRGQNLDGTWNPASRVEGIGFIGSGLRGVLIGTVGAFDFYAARAALDLPPSQRPVTYAWTGIPDDSTSTRTAGAGTVTNLFTNPRLVTPNGTVTVWENLTRVPVPDPVAEGVGAGGWSYGSNSDMSWSIEATGGPDLYPGIKWMKRTCDTATTYAGTIYTGTSGVTDRWAAVEPDTEYRVSMYFISTVPMDSVRVVAVSYDSDGASLDETQYVGYTEITPGVWEEISGVITTPADAAYVRIYCGSQNAVPFSPGDYSGGTAAMVIRNTERVVDYFDFHYSPNPDLETAGTPGSTTATLEGVRVAGLRTESMRAPVQTVMSDGTMGVKTYYSNPAATSGNNADYGFYVLGSGLDYDGDGTLTVVAKLTIPEGYDSTLDGARTRRIAYGTSSEESPQYGPEPGEYLVRHTFTNYTGANIRFGGGGEGGRLPIWSNITVTDTVDYAGPPFSGDTPDNLPPWSPGLGHSGCAFVGNPTWTATSGVNGGQVGYAATLKEVGDWQQ